MEPTMVILLVICIGLASQGYYFGFLRPPKAARWLQQSTFVFMAFLMAPMLPYVLWLQAGAVDRLSQMDVAPHPASDIRLG